MTAFFIATTSVLLSTALIWLSSPGGPMPWLMLVAFAPIFYVTHGASLRKSTLLWWGAGTGFYICQLYWTYPYMRFALDFQALHSGLFLVMMAMLAALPYAISLQLVRRFRLGTLTHCALLTSLIYFNFLAVFPGDPSIAFFRTPVALQTLDLLGHFFPLLLIFLANAGFAQMFLQPKSALKYSIYIGLGLGIVLIYGHFRLKHFETILLEDSPTAHLGIIQPNIQGKDLSPIFGNYIPFGEQNNTYLDAIAQTQAFLQEHKNLSVVIWPEAPIDFGYGYLDRYTLPMHEFVESSQTPLLFVAVRPWTGLKGLTYSTGKNTLLRLNPDLSVEEAYHKVNLIPFSEYIPFESTFPFLRTLMPGVFDMTPGTLMNPIALGPDLEIIPLICYDGIFPSFPRRFADIGGNLLLTLDNDTNFGPTRASEIHFSVELPRAIELRMPLVRVNNSGPSSLVELSGRVDPASETPQYRKASVVYSPTLGSGSKTLYQRIGYLFPHGLLLLSLIHIGYRKFRH